MAQTYNRCDPRIQSQSTRFINSKQRYIRFRGQALGCCSDAYDTSPFHTYAAEGFYEVCLTVSNTNGADTHCRTILVRDSLSAIVAVEKQIDFTLYPNPATDHIFLQSSENLGTVNIRLYDLQGRLISSNQKEILYNKSADINIESIVSGFYLMEFWKDGIKLGGAKLVVSR